MMLYRILLPPRMLNAYKNLRIDKEGEGCKGIYKAPLLHCVTYYYSTYYQENSINNYGVYSTKQPGNYTGRWWETH